MTILQGVIFIEVDINTRNITFLRTDTVNDYDKNTTNIYVQAIYRNSDGDKTYLSSEDIKNYVFTLYTLKPGTNNPFTINGVVTTRKLEIHTKMVYEFSKIEANNNWRKRHRIPMRR